MRQYPARRYALVLDGESEGLAQAGRKLDLIAFERGYMQRSEIGYQLKDLAQVLVGGEAAARPFPHAEILAVLQRNPHVSASQLGSQIVQQQIRQHPAGVHTAIDLSSQKELGAAVKDAVQALIDEKVPADLIYTAMMSVRSIEGSDPAHPHFDLRDLPAFLTRLSSDPRLTSEKARQALERALQAQRDTVLAHRAGGNHGLWGNAKGVTAFMPWQAPTPEQMAEYRQLDWARETGWDRLLDYTFDPASPRAGNPPRSEKEPTTSSSQKLGGLVLRAYKKWVSGHLNTACSYTPSCSHYTRQAIMQHGLLEGSKFGAIRWISCDGSHSGHHHVPGSCDHDASGAPVPLLAPPTARPSGLRRSLTQAAATCAGLAGKVLGAVGAALVGAPVGLVLGAVVGRKMGTGRLPEWNQQLFTRYNAPAPEKIEKIESRLAGSALKVRNFVLARTGSETLSNLIGGACGVLSGAVMGALGGALSCGRIGAQFGGLAAANATREALGQLPKDPYNEELLQSEFH